MEQRRIPFAQRRQLARIGRPENGNRGAKSNISNRNSVMKLGNMRDVG